MARIRFIEAGITSDVPDGTTVLDAARRVNVRLDSPCNGAGTCGKCRVKILSGDRSAWEEPPHGHATEEDRARGIALACQCAVRGDIAVSLQQRADTDLKILCHGLEADIAVAPHIVKVYDAASGSTTVYASKTVIAVEPGNTVTWRYGVAVDIGTTTLVASLVDLSDGAERAVASSLNPQAFHAQDVLSRIKLGTQPDGLRMLHGDLIAELNRLIGELTLQAHLQPEHIYEAVFSGNTTMVHLATNTSPASLGKYPYTPVVRGGSFNAAALGLAIARQGVVYVPPIVSAYVGADITSGILVTRLTQQSGTTLFVDIGTNGEMVLAVNGTLTATSTAAGPAFEGMNISCGMRAGAGAIELVTINDGAISLGVIGGAAPSGICGSGLLDAVGELAAHGCIDRNGRFRGHENGHRTMFDMREGKPVFRLAAGVFLTQKDIRQVQLAKAAVRAGINTMLRVNNLSPDHVDRVLIAGSFGYHLRAQSLYSLGLLPRAFAGKVAFVGNTSKSGARAFLINERLRDEACDWTERINVLELANDPEFEKTFIRALLFE